MTEQSDERLLLALRQNDETRDVDYKAAMAWDEKDKAACCGIVKDILAMANTQGGLIIIGVNEPTPNTFIPTGVPAHMANGWEATRVANFVQNYADPPIDVGIRHFDDKGLTFIVIDVPPFPNVPHLCTKGYEKDNSRVLSAFALYVRTASKESAPIKSSADFDVIIERAVRNRSERLLTSVRSILVGADITTTVSAAERFEGQLQQAQQRANEQYPETFPALEGFRQVVWWPARFDEQRFTLDALRVAAQHAYVQYRPRAFLEMARTTNGPQAMQDGIEVRIFGEAPFPAPMDEHYHLYDYWQLRQSGFFFKASLMAEEILTEGLKGRHEKVVWWDETAAFVGEAIDAVARVYELLGVTDEEVTVRVRITDARDRGVGNRNIMFPTISARSALSEVHYQVTRPIEDWQAGRVDLAAAMTRELMLRFNWADAPSFEAPVKQLFDYQLR